MVLDWGFLNEIQFILVAQEVSKLPKVKVWGPKQLLSQAPPAHIFTKKINVQGPGKPIFNGPQTLSFGNFAAPWATRMHMISFESINQGHFEFYCVKTETAFKVYYIHSNYPFLQMAHIQYVFHTFDLWFTGYHGQKRFQFLTLSFSFLARFLLSLLFWDPCQHWDIFEIYNMHTEL